MSDFDKEAEREKLREKYGEEEEKRKATEQMSELLLKGATMTNAHCTDCGDPIFRYDGQEFCPTCQKPVARDQPSEGEDHIEVADPSDEATVQFGDGEAADGQEAADASAADQTDAVEEAPANGAADANAADPSDADADQPTGDATQEIPSADPDRTPSSGDVGGRAVEPHSGDVGGRAVESHSGDASTRRDETAETPLDRSSGPAPSQRRGSADDSVTAELSAAESLLAETVHRFAQQAAETEDPRTAREHLKAAREAAEALDAVRF